MIEKLIKLKNGIYTFLMVSSGIYFLIRIISLILVLGFDFVIFFKENEINLLHIFPTLDILFGAICFMFGFIYFNGFKRVVISFLGLLVFIFSFTLWIPVMVFTNSFTTIEIPESEKQYAVTQDSSWGNKEERILLIQVYKEHYPFLYKLETKKSERFSEKLDRETIDLFNEKQYKYDEKNKILYYGKMEIPLK